MSGHIKKHSGGPPAVDSNDESFLKNRRLQGRIAQKRYRDRKNHTIASLEKRNNILESTINDMVRAFVDFHDTTVGASIPLSPTKFARELRQVTVKFIECAKSAIDITEDDTSTASSVENVDKDYQMPKETSKTQSSRDKNATHEHITSLESPSPPAMQSLTSHDTPLLSSRAGQLDSNLAPTAFGFAYYLDYSAVEYGLMCISLPRTRSSDILRIFKLSLCYNTPDQIIADLYRLRRGAVDNPHAPLRHLGGAGLHYKSAEEFAIRSERLETSLAPRSLYENAKKIAISQDMIKDLSDFEGEWFDARDVEHYLRQKGIFIDQNSMKVVASLDQILTSAMDFPGVMGNMASKVTETFFSGQIRNTTSTIGYPQHSLQKYSDGCEKFGDDFLSDTSLDRSAARPLISGYNQQLNSFYYNCDHFGFGPERTHKSSNSPRLRQQLPIDQFSSSLESGYNYQVLLDLNLMIDALKRTAVCLVRSPGFRKYDIDSALRASIVGLVN
ncbi:hypothetical protein V1509DRAFT_665974 [Lipomyces kononenkoae]